MDTHWILKTYGDPLEAVRSFLLRLYLSAELDGMLVPISTPGAVLNRLELLTSPRDLAGVDPFLPLSATNSTEVIRAAAGMQPGARLAAVLRSCEIRALLETARRGALRMDHWILIGVDCLAVYPAEDYIWRAQRAGGPEALTRETLRTARQGGIAAYRFRNSCQICDHSWSEFADLNIGVLGLPARQMLLVSARDRRTAEDLKLHRITHDTAPNPLVENHRQTIERVRGVRERSRKKLTGAMPAGLPSDAGGVIALLEDCAPCRRCLEACPIYAGELAGIVTGAKVSLRSAAEWLSGCVSCGKCEDACPQHKPLTAVFGEIKRRLEPVGAAG